MRLPVSRPNWELSLAVESRAAPLPILNRMSGAPLGLPDDRWPFCEICARAMSFIGQLDASVLRPGGAGGAPFVVFAFLCTNPETSGECHMYALEPRQQKNGRIVMAEAAAPFRFASAPASLPARPYPGLVATSFTQGDDEVDDADVDFLLYGGARGPSRETRRRVVDGRSRARGAASRVTSTDRHDQGGR